MREGSIRRRALLAALSCLLLASPPLRADGDPKHVHLQLKWTHQFQFGGYYQAIEQGYYRDAGLKVDLIEAQPGDEPVDRVLSGNAEFGVGNSSLMLLRAQGKPVVVLAVVYQHSPLLLVARHDASLSDLHDLAGRAVMVEPDSADVYAYFRNEGLDLKSIEIRPHTHNADDLLHGKVAAMTAYSTDEPFLFHALNFQFLEFTPREGGVDFYGDNLFTTEGEIAAHPEVVRAFRAASLKGWAYAVAHSEETIDLILRKYPRGRTREQLLFEAQETLHLMHPDLIEVGYMNPGRWRHIAETYQDLKMIPASFTLDGFVYNPDPKPDLRILYWLLGGVAAVAALALFWLFPLLFLNGRLRREKKTVQRAREQAEAAGEAKSRYLAVMSHEIRAPLGGIAQFLQLMIDDYPDLPELARKDLEMISHSAKNLHGMAEELLDWSRVEARRVELETLPVRVRPFLDELRAVFRPSAQAKGVELTFTVAEGMPEMFWTDPLRLRQILANLVANAIKFTPKGAVTLTAEKVGDLGKDGVRLRFAVGDSGIGIAPEALGGLFQPYKQADSSIARRFGGTGLGLSISLGLARLLGGDIKVASEPGQGSTFTVEIEAGLVEPPPSKPKA